MTRINLLPWREELKKQRQNQFIAMLVAGALAGAAVWGAGHAYYGDLIDHQRHRNAMLQTEIKKLDAQIVKIKDLESTKRQLISRMNVIQQLQQGRPQVVHLFHELATTLPDGMYLTTFEQKGSNLTIRGVAESNARISSYMERLDGSDWLDDPHLDVIQVKDAGGRRSSEYTLRVKQVTPSAEQEAKS